MRIIHKQTAAAMIATIILLAVIGILTGLAWNITAQQGRMTRNSAILARATLVADSEMERLFDRWRDLMERSNLEPPTQDELDAICDLPSSFEDVHPGFADLRGTFLREYRGQRSHSIREVDSHGRPATAGTVDPTVGPLMGLKELYSLNRYYEAKVAVEADVMGRKTQLEVIRTFVRSDAPVFQAAIFFNGDVELHPGANMTIRGPVISNRRTWLATARGTALHFKSLVSASNDPNIAVPGEQYHIPSGSLPFNIWAAPGLDDPYAYHEPAFTGSDPREQRRISDRLEPAGKKLRDSFDVQDTNPNNDGYHELIERPNPHAPDPLPIAEARFYNQASLRIGVQYKTASDSVPVITATYKDGRPVSASLLQKIKAAMPKRQEIYDKRENKPVRVTPVDIAKFDHVVREMNASASVGDRFNGIVHFSDQSGGTGPWAIKLENGRKLPTAERPESSSPRDRGFTVATDGGVYIKGDYNSDTSGGRKAVPAAVMADAVMFLSNNWKDENSSNPLSGMDDGDGGTVAGSARRATETTYNTAIMSGNIPFRYDPDNNPKTNNSYGASGGAHNLPRMLENWNGVNQNFTGSMVQLYNSLHFVGQWRVGDVYLPPIRNWSYNPDFARRPSPGMFSVTKYFRGTWRRH